jgi:hypothetical protein
MQINPSAIRQILYAALLGAVVVLAPAVADQVSSGVSGLADVSFWNVAVGAALAAAVRAAIALIPVTSTQG